MPAATRGVRMVASPRGFSATSAFDNPLSSRFAIVESLTVFEDVFVPMDRVFLLGEWQAAGPLARTFVEFHRFTATSYKPPLLELLAGGDRFGHAALWFEGFADEDGEPKLKYAMSFRRGDKGPGGV